MVPPEASGRRPGRAAAAPVAWASSRLPPEVGADAGRAALFCFRATPTAGEGRAPTPPAPPGQGVTAGWRWLTARLRPAGRPRPPVADRPDRYISEAALAVVCRSLHRENQRLARQESWEGPDLPTAAARGGLWGAHSRGGPAPPPARREVGVGGPAERLRGPAAPGLPRLADAVAELLQKGRLEPARALMWSADRRVVHLALGRMTEAQAALGGATGAGGHETRFMPLFLSSAEVKPFAQDKEVMLLAVGLFEQAYARCAGSLACDHDIVLAAIGRRPQLFRELPPSLRQHRPIALAAASLDGHNFRHVAAAFRADREMAFAAVASVGCAYRWASQVLQKDPRLAALAVGFCARDPLPPWQLHESLDGHREVIRASVKRHPPHLISVPRWARADREVGLVIARSAGHPELLDVLAAPLRADWEIALTVVRHQPQRLEWVSESLLGRKDFLLAALRQSPRLLDDAGRGADGGGRDGSWFQRLRARLGAEPEALMAALRG